MLLFKNRNFVVCTVTGMFIMLGMMGTMSYLPTYFQIVDGLAPEQAGLMTVPMMAGVLLTAVGTGFLATKTGRYKWMPIASLRRGGRGLRAAVAASRVGTPLLVTGVFLFVLGFGIGLGQQILVLIVQNEFPHAIVGTATAANNFFRQIGSTLGASLVGALFTSRLAAGSGCAAAARGQHQHEPHHARVRASTSQRPVRDIITVGVQRRARAHLPVRGALAGGGFHPHAHP